MAKSVFHCMHLKIGLAVLAAAGMLFVGTGSGVSLAVPAKASHDKKAVLGSPLVTSGPTPAAKPAKPGERLVALASPQELRQSLNGPLPAKNNGRLSPTLSPALDGTEARATSKVAPHKPRAKRARQVAVNTFPYENGASQPPVTAGARQGAAAAGTPQAQAPQRGARRQAATPNSAPQGAQGAMPELSAVPGQFIAATPYKPSKRPGYDGKNWPPPPPPNTPISLDDTIYGVLRTHRELKGMQENRQVLEHELRRARAGFGPSVDATGEAGGNLLSDNSTRNANLDKQMYGIGQISGRLTQPLFDGFASRSRVRSAKSTLESVRSRVYDTATTLSLDGIIAHIDLLRQREIYALAQRNVVQHRAILGMTQDRSALGADTEADVSQAQSRLQRALSSLAEAQANLLVAEDTWSRLTGMPPTPTLNPVPPPGTEFEGPGRVLELAQQHNPKIAAYIQDIRVLVGDKELAESAFYPTINAEVGPTYTDRGGSTDRWVYSFDAVGTMRWNLFNSGADVAETRAASARIRQARQTLYNFMDDLKLEIESTWSNYLSAKDQYTHYMEAIKYNQFTRTAFLEQFQMGMRSLLDVLDAENELYNSSTQAATAAGNILVGAYRLCALTGNLLPMMDIDTKPLANNPAHDPETPAEKFDMGWFN